MIQDLNIKSRLRSINVLQSPIEIKLFNFYMKYHNRINKNYPDFHTNKTEYMAYEKLIKDIEEAILNENDVRASELIKKL
jgi:hypothetical protein